MTGGRIGITLDGEWLVEVVDGHTCGTGPEGHYGAHEPGCGLVPLMTLAELDELLTTLGKYGAPINRPAEVIAAIKAHDRRIALHADRLTVGPTSFAADHELSLAPGEVAMALAPHPTGDDEVVLYGSPEQLADLAESIVGMLPDLVDEVQA